MNEPVRFIAIPRRNAAKPFSPGDEMNGADRGT
jgi:hypothetical protein